jgi:hypothetical protein
VQEDFPVLILQTSLSFWFNPSKPLATRHYAFDRYLCDRISLEAFTNNLSILHP